MGGHRSPIWGKKLGGHITRWDGAVDDYAGVHSVDLAVEFHNNGRFNAGGREPRCWVAGDWPPSDGLGCTLYIGSRKSGKLLRVYEKRDAVGRSMASLGSLESRIT